MSDTASVARGSKAPLFGRVTSGPTRQNDVWGSGHYGSGRKGRLHHGLDLLANPGEAVTSPVDGVIVRQAAPYTDDPRYGGVLIRGTGPWTGFEIKLFYVESHVRGAVRIGEVVGHAQDVRRRYPGIGNHVHIEVRRHGIELDPAELFGPRS
jgi:hypothetical protein